MEFIRTLDVTFDVGDATRLSVENRSGAITVRGDGGREVRIAQQRLTSIVRWA